MDVFFLIVLWWILVLGIPTGIGLLCYYLPKKLGYPRLAKWLTTAYLLLTVYVVVIIAFEDELFTKNDAMKIIELQDIHLEDDFQLVTNKSVGLGKFETFELKISDKDKATIIKKITQSNDFKHVGEKITEFWGGPYPENMVLDINQHYETKTDYVTDNIHHEPGYAVDYKKVMISKAENILTFERQSP